MAVINIYCYKAGTPLEQVAIVDDFISFNFTRSFSGVGSWQLTLDANSLNAARVKDMKYIRVSENVAGYVVRHKETQSNGKNIITYYGVELKGIAARRIIIPPTGEGYLNYYNKSPEYVIAHLLDTQILNPTDSAKQISGTIDSYIESATSITYNGRYQNLKTDIEELATAYNVGWAADIVDNAIVWRIWQGTDRTETQTENDKAIFSYEYDSLNESNIETGEDVPNYVVVAGQGVGAERQLAIIDNSETGLERNELYIDARDITQEEGVSALTQRGVEKLALYGSQTVYNATLSQFYTEKYRESFELGDAVTVKDSKLDGGSMDFPLTEIEEVYEESDLEVRVVFGYDKGTLKDLLKRVESKTESILYSEEAQSEEATVLGVPLGGTGLDSITVGYFLVGNGTNALSMRTPAQVLSDIGAAASSHNHTVANITDFPTSMPASDVYAWAKAATKPSYTYTEVGAAASSHTHSYVPIALRSDWNSLGVIANVVGQLSWKNYGNNHTIFDASQGTSPDGGAVDRTNSAVAWTSTYPTLMGWNGGSTYGVRVDSARIADIASKLITTNYGSSLPSGSTGEVFFKTS